ncbi:hypothetical protein ACJIZ3_002166 [Penstemon smallii]|uniref:Uncharacterized protein n=1 Tax=Penstemon smallii TaxID=265156 RepID=A0ABD3U879_9LAMI
MKFGEMLPVFGKVTAEWLAPNSTQLDEPFLFLAPISTPTHFTPSNRAWSSKTWDDIGIGGSWSEFVDYMITSLGSSDVKLIMEGSEAGGASRAKLVAQKAKGMPRISIPLPKLVGAVASEAMARLSLELYTDYKNVKTSLIEEKERKFQLTKTVAAEQEKNDILQKQLDMVLYSRKPKSQKISDAENSDSTSIMVSQGSPGNNHIRLLSTALRLFSDTLEADKQAAHNIGSTKVANRVVPAHRRTKVRGVVLEDTEDGSQN